MSRTRTLVTVMVGLGVGAVGVACGSDVEEYGEDVDSAFVGRSVGSVQSTSRMIVDGRDVAPQLGIGGGRRGIRSASADPDDWVIVAHCPRAHRGSVQAAVVRGREWQRLQDESGDTDLRAAPPTDLLDCQAVTS